MFFSYFIDNIDRAIRFLLYVCLFWLPYSPAVIESTVVLSLVLWLAKHACLSFLNFRKDRSLAKAIKSGFRPAQSEIDKPIFIFLFICLVSSSLSLYHTISLWGLLTKTLEWFIVFYLVLEVIVTPRQLWLAIIISLFTAGATAFDGIQQFYITGMDIFNHRELTRGGVTAGFQHTNSLAAFLVITIPLLLAVTLTSSLSQRQRSAGVALLLIMGWTLFLTFSRTAWMSVVVSVLIMMALLYKRSLAVLWVGFLLITLIVGKGLSNQGLDKFRLGMSNITQAVDWRTEIWKESLSVFRERPWLGYGINTYMSVFQAKRDLNPYYPAEPTYAHNCYIQMLVEVGIVGLLSFCWIIATIAKYLYKFFREADKRSDDLVTVLAGFCGSIAGFLLHGFFDVHLYSLQLSVSFWFVVGLMFSTLRLLKQQCIYGIKTQ